MSSRYQTELEQRFAVEYLKDANGAQAYLRAGGQCTVENAARAACRLLGREDIQAAVAKANAERMEEAKVSAALVLKELLALATVDIAAAFDEAGNLKPIHEIPVDVRKAIAGVDVYKEYAGRGENRERIGETKKVKFWDRPRALEMLGRHIQLFKDSLALTGADGGAIQIDDSARATRIAAILEAGVRRRDTGEDLV